ANHAKYTKRNPHNRAIRRGLQIQQELTEETEGRVSLRYLCCLLFKSPGAPRSRRTSNIQQPTFNVQDYCPWPSAPVPSRSIKMSRGSAPLLGPTMPRFSSSSMMRAARV